MKKEAGSVAAIIVIIVASAGVIQASEGSEGEAGDIEIEITGGDENVLRIPVTNVGVRHDLFSIENLELPKGVGATSYGKVRLGAGENGVIEVVIQSTRQEKDWETTTEVVVIAEGSEETDVATIHWTIHKGGFESEDILEIIEVVAPDAVDGETAILTVKFKNVGPTGDVFDAGLVPGSDETVVTPASVYCDAGDTKTVTLWTTVGESDHDVEATSTVMVRASNSGEEDTETYSRLWGDDEGGVDEDSEFLWPTVIVILIVCIVAGSFLLARRK